MFVGNISFDVDEDAFRAHFAECGDIKQVRWGEDRETGQFKGYGHLEFVDGDSTIAAVQLAGKPLMGRNLRIDYAMSGKRTGAAPRKFGNDSGGGGGGRGGNGWNSGPRKSYDNQGRGGGGRGGGGFSGGNKPVNKSKGCIASFEGKKISFE